MYRLTCVVSFSCHGLKFYGSNYSTDSCTNHLISRDSKFPWPNVLKTHKTPSDKPRATVNRSFRFILSFQRTNQGNIAKAKSMKAV